VLAGLSGLAGAVAVRVAIAGDAGARSPAAGLGFAGVLLVLACVVRTSRSTPDAASGARPVWPRRRDLAVGLVGAAVLCAGPALRTAAMDTSWISRVPMQGFAPWVGVVALVAIAEEILLRGALFTAVTAWRGPDVAVLVTAIAFAAVHVPVYGLRVLPLDFAVGVGLGALRVWTGTVTGPSVAHVVADLAGWWLR
jgi:membrane protease YdiL (CAAX protease family)